MVDEGSQENKGKVSELKDDLCNVADTGKQADKHTRTTKAIGEHVGRVCGKEMQWLVLHLKEGNPVEPECPDGGKATDKDKAVWSKLHDRCLKKQEACDDHRAKVFTVIMVSAPR